MRVRTRNIKEVDAILTADFHLRKDTPICRTDNFEEAQWNKVDYISKLQKQYNCPVIHSGDLFHHWKPSPYLLSKAIKHLPDNFHTIYGNHDLPQHNLDLIEKTGIYTLVSAGKIKVIPFMGDWGLTPDTWKDNGLSYIKGMNYFVWHTDVYQGKKPWFDCKWSSAAKLLRKYPQYDLILTGHNHQTFVETYEGRLLINPGSITRLTSAQIDHVPTVFLYHAESNTVTPHVLPYDKTVVRILPNTELLQKRDERIDAFINRLNNDWEGSLNFDKNIEIFLSKNNIPEETKKIINNALEN